MLFRTLVRFERVGKKKALVVIPAWRPERKVAITLKDLPKDLRKQAVAGFRCHAKANLGADSPLDLELQEWHS